MFTDVTLSWYYNECHHGKGPMDGIGGTVKHMVFKKVKSGHVLVNSPKDFADASAKFLPTISMVYLTTDGIMDEPEGTVDARAIKGTLKIHMFRRRIVHGIHGIDFFEMASDSEPFHT